MLYLPIFGSRTNKYDTYLARKKYLVHRIFECIVTALTLMDLEINFWNIRHTMTIHQMDISVHSVWWKVLNIVKTSYWTKQTSPDIAGQGGNSLDKIQT